MNVSRRAFLRVAAGAGSVFLAGDLRAASFVGNRGRVGDDGNVLVLIQLSGGNDGLSTVVPFADEAYHRLRKSTRIEPDAVLKLDDATGLHPNLKGLKSLYDRGRVAVVRGVGYPEPNRSHFESYEIWHTADLRGRAVDTGWIGRYADLLPDAAASATTTVHVGKTAPYSMTAKRRRPAVFETPDSYRWIGGAAESETLTDACGDDPPARAGRDQALAKIRRTLLEAQSSSAAVRAAAARYKAQATYPREGLAGALHTTAALVKAGLGVRVVSIETGGFDTHVDQRPRHDRLMTQLDGSLAAFYADLAAQKLDGRVTTVVYSEFGRRAAENGSGGTDHGAASCLFVLGGGVKGGLYGRNPDLVDLDRGDPRFTTDFRGVFATLLQGVLGADPKAVLGAAFAPVAFL